MTTDSSDDKTQILPDDEDGMSDTIPSDATPDEDENDPLLGRRIGNYQVLSVLGRGGFGSVYKAEDTKLGRMVALKFLNQATKSFHSELFKREAKALGILSKHPNIVQIHTWDEFEGKNFFVLEYMKSSVADFLTKYPEGMPVDLSIRIIAECSDALAFAHDSEILHRDIKSPNILIESEDGPAKIADFGLARICGVSRNTIEGEAIGSPAYMAPEQVRGKELTHLCDIYSLGVTLYELLCGQPPITGTTVLELLEKVRNNERVPLQERKPGLPEKLYAIIDKATAQEPADRYQSATELAEALRALNSKAASPTIPPAALPDDSSAEIHTKSNTIPFLAAVAVLLLMITGGVAYLFTSAAELKPLSPTDIITTPAQTNDSPPIPEENDTATLPAATTPEPTEPTPTNPPPTPVTAKNPPVKERPIIEAVKEKLRNFVGADEPAKKDPGQIEVMPAESYRVEDAAPKQDPVQPTEQKTAEPVGDKTGQTLEDTTTTTAEIEAKAARTKAATLRTQIEKKERRLAKSVVEKADTAWQKAEAAGDDYTLAKTEYNKAAQLYTEAIQKANKRPGRVGPVPN